MHVVYFNTKDSLPIEPASILRYVASEYQKDTQDHRHVFQVIGDPVEGDNAQITHWTFPTFTSPTITHIKVI